MTDYESTTVDGRTYLVVSLRDQEVIILAKAIAVELRRLQGEADGSKITFDHLRGPLHDGTHPDCIVCHPVSA